MDNKLVFEIGTEELPSSCIIEGRKALKDILTRKFKQERIGFTSIETFGTPRRLTAVLEGVAAMQKSHNRVVTGPPKAIAFDGDGKPTRAATGFAGSLKIDVNDLEEIPSDRGIYMGKSIREEGRPVMEVMPGLLKKSIGEIPFGKQMSWGNYDIKFARPIRWIVALLGDKVINFELEGLKTGRLTYGLRTIDDNPLTIEDADGYLDILTGQGLVILDSDRRRQIIENAILEAQQQLWSGNYRVVLDQDLLEEVVNLVEHPNVLVGKFSERFLYIPKDILIKAIEYHQKYFAVTGPGGEVTTSFVMVQNGTQDITGDIVKGNQRVLEARLSDAVFFYEEDRKQGFDHWLEKLKGVIFYSGIGSMYDQIERLVSLSDFLCSSLGKDHIKDDLKRAAGLCKCDLVTNMVVEFPQLQGIVGREYALEIGEKPSVAKGIFEHYRPRFAGDQLPRTEEGALLSVAEKMDTICGMFLLDNIPTGSEDPFALRRKASGIVLSLLDKGYDLDLEGLIEYNLNLYQDKFGIEKPEGLNRIIFEFILARYRFKLEKEGKRLDILEAVAAAGTWSVTDMDLRYRALEKFMGQHDIELIANPMIRCKNIIKEEEIAKMDAGRFRESGEKKLYEAVEKVKEIVKSCKQEKKYFQMLTELEKFGEAVNKFFDQVLVMDEDENIRQNRISLVKEARDLYLFIADFSRLVIEG
ncbi:MAG: glycine--tRNA ligase subunit beta [Actinomycetia bacterium]|nr:glycine--tRNA ligase subunit beta [Actinomycetes bacterium]